MTTPFSTQPASTTTVTNSLPPLESSVTTNAPYQIASSVTANTPSQYTASINPYDTTSGGLALQPDLTLFSEQQEGSGPEEPTSDVEDDVKKEARKIEERKSRARKWRVKKFFILVIYCIALVTALACLTKWAVLFTEFAVPPSEYASDANSRGLMGFIGLSLLSVLGFFMLAFKISNMFVGMFHMFCIILVISFSLNSTSRAIYSYNYDTIGGTMRVFYKKAFDDTGNIPEFYNKLQTACECCGINEDDRLLDWPTHLEHPDLPKSCCKNPKTAEVDCKGLGRMYNQSRIPSGFTIIINPSQMLKWAQADPTRASHIIPLERFKIAPLQENLTNELASEVITDAANKIIDSDYATVTNTFFSKEDKTLNPNNRVHVAPAEVLIALDTLVEQWISRGHELGISRGSWIYFQLPIKSPLNIRINKGEYSTYRPFYVSRGLAESNMIYGTVWERKCEKNYDNITSPTCQYLNMVDSKFKKRVKKLKSFIVKKKPGAEAEEDIFFKTLLQRLMIVIGSMSLCVMVFVFILAIFFWYYYSRLKAEEQENLAPPTDFDLLHLDLPSYEELDETTRRLEYELLKQRINEQKRRVETERQRAKTEGGGRRRSKKVAPTPKPRSKRKKSKEPSKTKGDKVKSKK